MKYQLSAVQSALLNQNMASFIPDLMPAKRETDVEDQSGLFEASKKVEISLGDDFMQALQLLDTTFKLPDTSRNLSKSLGVWRQEAERVFPQRTGKISHAKPITNEARGEASKEEEHRSRKIVRTRPHQGVRRAAKPETLVDGQTWDDFSVACNALFESLHAFLTEIDCLSGFHDTWCKIAVAELMVTLAEMLVVLTSDEVRSEEMPAILMLSTEDVQTFKGQWHEGEAALKKRSDLRAFAYVRFKVCEKQLVNIKDSLDEYKRHEITRVHSSQRRVFDGLSNITQVSTFFAAVVASTLQFSLTANQSVPFIMVNILWLTSLVFSIGAALNSFLGMTLRKAMSSTPRGDQLFYIKFWVDDGDAVLLVVSIVAYALGLGIYVAKSQHPAVAVFTCLGAACCALGIALVWQNHWNLRNTYRSSEGSRIKGSPFKIDRNRNILPPIDGPNYISTQLKGVTVAKPIIYMDEESKPGTEGATKGSHENGILMNSAAAFETKQQEDSRIIDFIDALEHLEKLPDSAPSSSVPLGEIAHMRCSPDGRWVAVCYKRACIVYDMENKFSSVTLRADDSRRSAEHVEWAVEGPYLLTRTEHELRLWKIPNDKSEYPKSNKDLECERRYKLRSGKCKYIKWLNQDEFIVLTNIGTLYRVDVKSNQGFKERIVFSQVLEKRFKISQVYPMISADDTDRIICLATKSAARHLPENVFKANGDVGFGVDYFLVLEKRKEEKGRASNTNRFMDYFWSGSADEPRDTHEIKYARILSRNVRNLKFCQEHRFMIINYYENELGTVPPELWTLNFGENSDDVPSNDPFGMGRQQLPPPEHVSDGHSNNEWGDASFAGPAHDVIICEVYGAIRFYRFDSKDEKEPRSIARLRHFRLRRDSKPAGERPLADFGEFYNPIFTWGDTISRPLMVATDLDGKGRVYAWSVLQEAPSTTRSSKSKSSLRRASQALADISRTTTLRTDGDVTLGNHTSPSLRRSDSRKARTLKKSPKDFLLLIK